MSLYGSIQPQRVSAFDFDFGLLKWITAILLVRDFWGTKETLVLGFGMNLGGRKGPRNRGWLSWYHLGRRRRNLVVREGLAPGLLLYFWSLDGLWTNCMLFEGFSLEVRLLLLQDSGLLTRPWCLLTLGIAGDPNCLEGHQSNCSPS